MTRITVFTVCLLVCFQSAQVAAFISNEDLAAAFAQLAKEHPLRAKVYRLGQSVQGKDISAIQINKNVTGPRDCLVPMTKYVANMHGNEVQGRLLMLDLATYLLQEYEDGNERIVNLLDNTDIHIVPTMNPDGYAKAVKGDCTGVTGRPNDNGVDLNRNFPDWDLLGSSRAELLKGRQRETRALMIWILNNPFVLSINFHDGAKVANYPYDDIEGNQAVVSKTPDHSLVKELASNYATRHTNMHLSTKFPGGITNGADWYIVAGGMQDFNYLFSNCIELTLELNECKYPKVNPRANEWAWNRESLLGYLESAHWGVKGLVTDRNDNVPENPVRVMVRNNRKPVYTSKCGEYWRVLLPGSYEVSAWGTDNYRSEWTKVTVTNGGGQAKRVDLKMDVEDEAANGDWEPDLKPPTNREMEDNYPDADWSRMDSQEYGQFFYRGKLLGPMRASTKVHTRAPTFTCQCDSPRTTIKPPETTPGISTEPDTTPCYNSTTHEPSTTPDYNGTTSEPTKTTGTGATSGSTEQPGTTPIPSTEASTAPGGTAYPSSTPEQTSTTREPSAGNGTTSNPPRDPNPTSGPPVNPGTPPDPEQTQFPTKGPPNWTGFPCIYPRPGFKCTHKLCCAEVF